MKINCCSPVYSKKSPSFLDDYFNYGKYRYKVISNEKPNLTLSKEFHPQSKLRIFVKIALLFTAVVPLIAGIRKIIRLHKWSSYRNVTIIAGNPISLLFQSTQNKLAKETEMLQAVKDINERKTTLQSYAKEHSKQDLKKLLKYHGEKITRIFLCNKTQKIDLSYLKYCPNVKRLDLEIDLLNSLEIDLLNSKDIEFLTKLPMTHLKKLSLNKDITGKCLTHEDIKKLVESPIMQNLTRLNLCGHNCSGIAAQAIAASPHLSHLTALLLDDAQLTNEDLSVIASSPHLSQLEVLALAFNSLDSDSAKTIVDNFKMLKYLYISGNKFNLQGFKTLSTLPNLKEIYAKYNSYIVGQEQEITDYFRQSVTVDV